MNLYCICGFGEYWKVRCLELNEILGISLELAYVFILHPIEAHPKISSGTFNHSRIGDRERFVRMNSIPYQRISVLSVTVTHNSLWIQIV
jgi:hypothetical protein